MSEESQQPISTPKMEEVKEIKDIPKSPEPTITLEKVVELLNNGYGKKDLKEDREEFFKTFTKYLKQECNKFDVFKNYNVLILYDNIIMVKGDSDRIYKAIKELDKDNQKPLLLILVSYGGEAGSAYLIGKLCREFCNEKFIVVVPRHAKSAATLLSCAADEIHMGSLSELGPIDPQIDNTPALGLKYSIDHIARLASTYANSSEMFARYLNLSIKPIQIGFYERVAESATQYAEKLLNTHISSLKDEPMDIAYKLVYEYKDHSFVIDKQEAINIFGSDTVKEQTNEYKLSDAVYTILSKVEDSARNLKYRFYFIGSVDTKPILFYKKS